MCEPRMTGLPCFGKKENLVRPLAQAGASKLLVRILVGEKMPIDDNSRSIPWSIVDGRVTWDCVGPGCDMSLQEQIQKNLTVHRNCLYCGSKYAIVNKEGRSRVLFLHASDFLQTEATRLLHGLSQNDQRILRECASLSEANLIQLLEEGSSRLNARGFFNLGCLILKVNIEKGRDCVRRAASMADGFEIALDCFNLFYDLGDYSYCRVLRTKIDKQEIILKTEGDASLSSALRLLDQHGKYSKLLGLDFYEQQKNALDHLAEKVKEVRSFPSPLKVDADQIKEEIARRGIHRVCHFTKITNLISIFMTGFILPRKTAQENFSEEELRLFFEENDAGRWDGKLDYTCFSVCRPNVWLLDRFERRKKNIWCVLSFAPELCLLDKTLFYSHNAAANDSQKGERYEDFLNMFQETIDVRTGRYDRTRLKACCTTTGQGEVLVRGNIQINNLLGVSFKSSEEKQIATDFLRPVADKYFKKDYFCLFDVSEEMWSTWARYGEH